LQFLVQMIRRMLVVSVALGATNIAASHADTRGTFRLGVMPLELESSADTPLFGGSVAGVVDDYNAAAAARDRMSGETSARIDASDLGVAETLLVFAPGLELGSGFHFFRIEAPIGIGDDLRSVGLGVYPINLQVAPTRSFAVYGSAGASASWLDRPGPGDVGALVTLRIAAGARVAKHLVVEVGYNAYALGGNINRDRIADMSATMTLGEPDKAIAAGEAHGIVDASLGVAF
jgi:hypothetical protein